VSLIQRFPLLHHAYLLIDSYVMQTIDLAKTVVPMMAPLQSRDIRSSAELSGNSFARFGRHSNQNFRPISTSATFQSTKFPKRILVQYIGLRPSSYLRNKMRKWVFRSSDTPGRDLLPLRVHDNSSDVSVWHTINLAHLAAQCGRNVITTIDHMGYIAVELKRSGYLRHTFRKPILFCLVEPAEQLYQAMSVWQRLD
jgi:hypothetical protein